MGGNAGTCSLAWHEQQSVMGEFLRGVHLQHDFTDVTLVSDDDYFIPAHGLVLSACSPFLASILKNKATNPTIMTITNYNCSHIQSLLTLLYCGEVVLTKDNLHHLESLAEQLQITCLMKYRKICDDCPVEVDKEQIDHHESSPYDVPNNSEPANNFNASPRMDLLKAKLTDLIKTSLRKEVEDHQTYWHCLCCGKRWKVTRHNARRHMETHLPRQKCEHCGDTFKHREVLIRHVKKKHGVNVNIMSSDVDETICNANVKMNDFNSYTTQISFLTSFKMVKMDVKVGENAWHCLVCGKSCKSKYRCKRHMEVHIEGLALSCKDCDKVFGNNRALKEHINHCKGRRMLSNHKDEEESVVEVNMKVWEERLQDFERDMATLI